MSKYDEEHSFWLMETRYAADITGGFKDDITAMNISDEIINFHLTFDDDWWELENALIKNKWRHLKVPYQPVSTSWSLKYYII